jgi:hypothetical protein
MGRPKETITMSVENIVRTYGRLCIKALKMSPHHYKRVGQIFFKSVTTGADWEQPINELLESNKRQLNPLLKDFYRACGCVNLVSAINTQEFIDGERSYFEALNAEMSAVTEKAFKSLHKKENN